MLYRSAVWFTTASCNLTHDNDNINNDYDNNMQGKENSSGIGTSVGRYPNSGWN